MKYPRSNFDNLFNKISNIIKTRVLPVGSYGRLSNICGDLDVLIQTTDGYSGSDSFRDLLSNGFSMVRFRENDGGEIWYNNQMCHVIFFNTNDYILKIVRFLTGKDNFFLIFHELYKSGYRVDTDKYKVFNRETNEEIKIISLDQLQSLIGREIPNIEIIRETINNFENGNTR